MLPRPFSCLRAGTPYIGVTSNPQVRRHRHRRDLIEGFTSRYGVRHLVWCGMHRDMAAAIPREKQLEKWNRDWKLNLIEAANPAWIDLAVEFGFEPLVDRMNGFPPSRE